MILRTTMIVLVAYLVSFGIAQAHPADNFTAKPAEDGYGTRLYGSPSDWSFGDVQFYSPYPSASSLSNAERYMLWGTEDSNEDYGRGAWWKDVVSIALVNYEMNGHLPTELTETAIRDASWQPTSVGMGVLQWYKSPLTDRFPRLDSLEFSRGDLYLKVLNEEEIQKACAKNFALNSVYNLGLMYGPGASEEDQIRVTMNSPVLYVRVYGENSVIYSELYYTYTKHQS